MWITFRSSNTMNYMHKDEMPYRLSPAPVAVLVSIATYPLILEGMKRLLELLGSRLLRPSVGDEEGRSRVRNFSRWAWELVMGVALVAWDVAVLWDKSWIRDSLLAWEVFQPVENDVWWMYMGHVVARVWFLVAVFADAGTTRWLGLLHHGIVVGALLAAWTVGWVRIACWAMAVCDVSDCLLATALAMRGLGRTHRSEAFFALSLTVVVCVRIFIAMIMAVNVWEIVPEILNALFAPTSFVFVSMTFGIFCACSIYLLLTSSCNNNFAMPHLSPPISSEVIIKSKYEFVRC